MLATVQSAVRRLAPAAGGSVRAAAGRAFFAPASAAQVRARACGALVLVFSLSGPVGSGAEAVAAGGGARLRKARCRHACRSVRRMPTQEGRGAAEVGWCTVRFVLACCIRTLPRRCNTRRPRRTAAGRGAEQHGTQACALSCGRWRCGRWCGRGLGRWLIPRRTLAAGLVGTAALRRAVATGGAQEILRLEAELGRMCRMT